MRICYGAADAVAGLATVPVDDLLVHVLDHGSN
jgi:hypothetical protein